MSERRKEREVFKRQLVKSKRQLVKSKRRRRSKDFNEDVQERKGWPEMKLTELQDIRLFKERR